MDTKRVPWAGFCAFVDRYPRATLVTIMIYGLSSYLIGPQSKKPLINYRDLYVRVSRKFQAFKTTVKTISAFLYKHPSVEALEQLMTSKDHPSKDMAKDWVKQAFVAWPDWTPKQSIIDDYFKINATELRKGLDTEIESCYNRKRERQEVRGGDSRTLPTFNRLEARNE